MSRLHHPNIVKLHEVLASETNIYFILKLRRRALRENRERSIRRKSRRRHFQLLVSAIEYCHARRFPPRLDFGMCGCLLFGTCRWLKKTFQHKMKRGRMTTLSQSNRIN
ncbi:hypothetical protein VNO80_20344 [Phaseolus coccineus]|uniref:Protein kinase domain-containing protein n=1 Tax=Phaseolus coccineus TaxID=3886 RepID=A0AAN9R118_PHACN